VSGLNTHLNDRCVDEYECVSGLNTQLNGMYADALRIAATVARRRYKWVTPNRKLPKVVRSGEQLIKGGIFQKMVWSGQQLFPSSTSTQTQVSVAACSGQSTRVTTHPDSVATSVSSPSTSLDDANALVVGGGTLGYVQLPSSTLCKPKLNIRTSGESGVPSGARMRFSMHRYLLVHTRAQCTQVVKQTACKM